MQDDSSTPGSLKKKEQAKENKPPPTPTNTKSSAAVTPVKSTKEKSDGKPNAGDLMKGVLCLLSNKLAETEQTEIIENEFDSFIKGGKGADTSRQMARFLQHVLKENSKLCKVLKAINQSIIASPFVRLKAAFPKELPFEDMGGTWKIIVHVLPGREVCVTHQKQGSSKEQPPVGGFDFEWELVMRFDWNLDSLVEVQLDITSIHFEKGILEEHKKKVEKILNRLSC